jgi:hypothetical protein
MKTKKAPAAKSIAPASRKETPLYVGKVRELLKGLGSCDLSSPIDCGEQGFGERRSMGWKASPAFCDVVEKKSVSMSIGTSRSQPPTARNCVALGATTGCVAVGVIRASTVSKTGPASQLPAASAGFRGEEKKLSEECERKG